MDEPNWLIRWTIFVFAGGDGAVAGAIFLFLAAVLHRFPFRQRKVPPFAVGLIAVIGLLLMICGSFVADPWFSAATVVWLLLVFGRWNLWRRAPKLPDNSVPSRQPLRLRLALLLGSIAWLLMLAVIEVAARFPSLRSDPVSTVMVIGDSVTAGLNDGEDTWPRQLTRVTKVEVIDASQPGATLRSARKQNLLLAESTGLLIVEVGGNDLLEGKPVSQFEVELDQLLAEVAMPGRTVVMFELPLPPLCARYGLIQRRLAARHHVCLIPKRLFATVLTTRGATVDGIHLSMAGQSQMTGLIQRFLDGRLSAGRGSYRRVPAEN
jgi:acyl-CoA thioesterase-1